MAKKDKQNFEALRKFFKIGYKKTAEVPEEQLFALKKKLLDSGKIEYVKEVFSSETLRLFKWWLSATHDSIQSWKNRTDLWTDCNTMYLNCGIISRSVELIADEVTQADSNQPMLSVEAESKQKKYIEELIDRLSLTSYIRPTASDVVLFGNALWILSFDEKGVNEIIPTDITNLLDRLEFSPLEVEEQINKNNKFLSSYRQQIDRIDQLIKMIEDKDDMASHFKKYLFGFQVGEYVVPPWRCLHFRNLTTKSPFVPFGIPVFVHSIAPYRQYDAAMTLRMTARGASFPKDVYELNFPTIMNDTEKLYRAIEFLSELQNSGINGVPKEQNGIGEILITIRDLFDFRQQESNIDLGRIDDIEMLRDDLIISTQLPRNLLDPNDSSFGDSGVSLIEKWKPFARLVYRIQHMILEQISQLIKIDMIHSGEFAVDEIDFILKMPYPESQTHSDIISSQSDLLRLCGDIIQSISDNLLDGQAVPSDVIKNIYMKFLPYDDETIETWINKSEKSVSKEEMDESVKKWKKLTEAIGKRRLDERIDDIIFLEKQNNVSFREGVFAKSHHYSSINQDISFPAELIRKLDVNAMKSKAGTSKAKLNEQCEYKFKYETPKEEGGEDEE